MIAYLPVVTTLLLFVAGTWLTVRHFKIVRTVAYIERMNNPSMASVRAAVDEWLEREESVEAKLSTLYADSELRLKVTVVYNILTELAIAHHYNVVNRKMTYDIWFPLVPKYWHRLRFYVAEERRRGSPIGYSLEALAARIEEHNRLNKGRVLDDPVGQRLAETLSEGGTPASGARDDSEEKSLPSAKPG